MAKVRLLMLIAIPIFLGIACKSTYAQDGSQPMGAPSGSNYKIAFEDNFQSGALNTNNWSTKYSYGKFGGHVHSTEDEYMNDDHVRVVPGEVSLVLEPSKNGNPAGLPYEAGMLSTFGKVSVPGTGSWWQVRAKFPAQPGLLACPMWLKPADGSYGHETDIPENFGDASFVTFTQHMHVKGVPQKRGVTYLNVHSNFPPGQDATQWHVYGCEIGDGYVSFYVDGNKVGTLHNTADIPNLVPTEPQYFLADIAIVDQGFQPIAGNHFPAALKISEVKAWTKQ